MAKSAGKGKGGKTTAAPTTAANAPWSYQEMPVPSWNSMGLTDMGQFVNQLAGIAAQKIPPINTAQIGKTAAGYANQDIKSLTDAYRLQQKQLLETGKQQQGLITQAGQSAANFTVPWAQGIHDVYQGMGDQQLAYAQGLSGATRDASVANAQAFNQQMANTGSPQIADPGRAAALGGALAGIGGLGGLTLGRQATAAYQGALGIPQQMLGYGQAMGAGVLGAAMQEAAKINPQIALAEAGRGKATREYMLQLTQMAQTDREFALKAQAMQADIVQSMGSLVSASNDQRIKFAGFQQEAVNSHNAVVTAQNNFKLAVDQNAEDARHNLITEGQAADANRLAQQTLQANINESNSRLENSWAETKGYYIDKDTGKPVALPGNKIVYGKNGSFRVVETLSPAEAAAAKASARTNRASMITAEASSSSVRGWHWEGQGKARHRVANEGNKLAYDKKGNFIGAKRDPTQYATGRTTTGAKPLTALQATNALTDVSDNLDKWANGSPPSPVSTRTGVRTPGYDPTSKQVTDAKLYLGAGGTFGLKYWDFVNRIVAHSRYQYSRDDARQMIAHYYIDLGIDPKIAAAHNLRVGQLQNEDKQSYVGLNAAGAGAYGMPESPYGGR